MPTARPRHTLTESDEIAAALRDAAEHWPKDADRPTRLLADLVREGHRAILAERGQQSRRRALEETAGVLRGVYPPGYLEELRRDWPE